MSQKKRVLLIGIDGATFNIISPLISQGQLPTFQRIAQQGTHGILNSVLPPMSATGWTSLVTGKNSGKHNIYDFYDNCNSSHNSKIINSQNIKAKTIWQILGDYDRKSILVNVPVTYPPTTINGIMICGMLTPPGQKLAFPEQLSDQLHQKNYITDIFYHFRESLDSYMELAIQAVTVRQQFLLELLQKNDWDFAMVVFTTTDRLQHTVWQHQPQIQQLYRKLDSLIEELLDFSDENMYSILISEHGFKSVTKKFFVNEWLWELGLLSKEISTQKASIPDFWEEQFDNNGEQNKFITNLLAKTGITKDNIRSFIPDPVCELIKRTTPASLRKIFPKENLIINWDKTRAYYRSRFSQGININLKGREPNGIVAPGKEYEQVRDQIIHELYRLKDPRTFENVVEEVYRGEEIFFGKYCSNAPDIIFVPRNYDYILDSNKRTTRLCISPANDDYPVISHHDSKGIFFVTGPSIKKDTTILNTNIFDIAPTILKILDIPVSNDMDGKVLYKLFEEDEFSIYENDELNLDKPSISDDKSL